MTISILIFLISTSNLNVFKINLPRRFILNRANYNHLYNIVGVNLTKYDFVLLIFHNHNILSYNSLNRSTS